MKNTIKDSLENPEQLEKLYRSDSKGFQKAFYEIYPEIADAKIREFWKTRLDHENMRENGVSDRKSDIPYLILICIISGLLIKIPAIFSLDSERIFFYQKNAGTIVLFGLSMFSFLSGSSQKIRQMILTLSVFIISAIYINLLPNTDKSHSINLAYIHLPLFLWCLFGFVFVGFDIKDINRRIQFLRFNGDLSILMAVISIIGRIITAMTIELFAVIDINIERICFDYIVIWGLVSAPVVASYLIHKQPFITNKIAPVMANIFSPLVLITLIIYLFSMMISARNPYSDRDFLIVFNLMLLVVMAIIVFSVAEISKNRRKRFSTLMLFALSIVAIIVNLVALSAILYRLREYGFTPNRTAVLGSNLLIFGNLLLIMIDLYRVNFRRIGIQRVEQTVARYLPIYALWTFFVVFAMPWIFGLK
jgi:hypothetical protein